MNDKNLNADTEYVTLNGTATDEDFCQTLVAQLRRIGAEQAELSSSPIESAPIEPDGS